MHGKNPDTHGRQHGLLVPTGRARIEAPLAFGTGEGMPIVGVLWREWKPPVLLTVIGGGGFAVSLACRIFASRSSITAAALNYQHFLDNSA